RSRPGHGRHPRCPSGRVPRARAAASRHHRARGRGEGHRQRADRLPGAAGGPRRLPLLAPRRVTHRVLARAGRRLRRPPETVAPRLVARRAPDDEMVRPSSASLALATMLLAGCGLRPDGAVPAAGSSRLVSETIAATEATPSERTARAVPAPTPARPALPTLP